MPPLNVRVSRCRRLRLKAIDEYVDRRAQRRDEIIEQIFTEDAELFRRLADA